jgi:Asp-tRNA(Asn)/Glu-tRNA(Gln) amidotransferase B subunit
MFAFKFNVRCYTAVPGALPAVNARAVELAARLAGGGAGS